MTNTNKQKTSNGHSFFIAGTMQGARQGSGRVDQTYRLKIIDIINKYCINPHVYCPLVLMTKWLAEKERGIRDSHAGLLGQETIQKESLDANLIVLTDTFTRLTELAGKVNVTIAYIPGKEPSMGTAMEMWSTYNNGGIVITISSMLQNLAILSTSSIILPNLNALSNLFSSDWLGKQILKPKVPVNV